MIKGTTKQGFRFRIDEATLDDWELVEMLSDMGNDDFLTIIPFAKKLLGLAQYNQLKKFCKDKKTNRVSATKMQETLFDIFNCSKDLKN